MTHSPSSFRDRQEAGRRLAERLAVLKPAKPVILAIARGGVPVAAEIARALEAPLDLVLVRKIPVPLQPGLALGAVADGTKPEIFINDSISRLLILPKGYIEVQCRKAIAALERERVRLRATRPNLGLSGRMVVVVDDGIATGSTMLAALQMVRRQGPKRCVVAVPVGAVDAIRAVMAAADEVHCLVISETLGAIGPHYRDFPSVSNRDVAKQLEKPPLPRSAIGQS